MLDANLDVTALQAADLQGLSPGAIAELATQMLARMIWMSAQLEARDKQAAAHKFKDTKIERMNAAQWQMFEETAAEDEASLEAQLQALQGATAPSAPPAADTTRRPRRQPLPEQLRRVVHRHEPKNMICPPQGAARPWCASART